MSRKLVVLALGVAVLVGIGSAQATGPKPSHPAVQQGETYLVTLITGDKVRYGILPGGKQVAVVEPADRGGLPVPSFRIWEFDGEVQVIPSDVAEYIPDALDPELFNITQLVEDELDDASTGSLPLIVEYEGGSRTAVPAVQPERTLESINASGARASKARAADLGRALAKGHQRRPGKPAPLGGSGSAGSTSTSTGPLAGVKKIWLDATMRATLEESVPQVGAPTAWAAGFDGSGTVVAVLDTGVDDTHPDLAGKVVDARNFTDSDGTADRYGHGTHVASTIAGTGAASSGLRKGTAPGARLVNGKVLNDNGAGFTSWIIDGMEWATGEKGAKVVNMSLGGRATDGTDPLSQAVDTLSSERGALFVISAGNRGRRGERTIGAPGAATSALTVGAVDKTDVLAFFSSRGPRLGDLAIKPEITAPGVAITAARASGTEMGDPVGDSYTTASGTSMSAPHVSGAAAIVFQAHPGWSREHVKGALVATATASPDYTVFEQGGGRLEVARAAAARATVTPAVLNLGFFRWPHTGRAPVSRTLTYTNASTAPIALDLAVDVRGERGRGEPAPAGTLTLSSASVTVPAGGSAEVQLVLDSALGEVGKHYAGAVTATEVGGVTVLRTPLAFYVEPEMYDLTVSAITRDGRAPSSRSGFIIVNVDDSRRFATGRAFRFGKPVELRVPAGAYSIIGAVYTEDVPRYTTTETVLVGTPELEIGKDTELTLDARDSTQLVIETPDHETRQGKGWGGGFNAWGFFRTPAAGPTATFSILGDVGPVFAQPSEPVSKGVYEAYTRWRLQAPDIRIRLLEPNPVTLHANYAYGNALLSDGRHELPLVWANNGLVEDFATIDVRGKVALMKAFDIASENWQGGYEQLVNASAAGAAAVILYNEHTPGFSQIVGHGDVGNIPTFVVHGTEGQQLRELLAQGSVKLELRGISKSPYLYDLIFPEQQRTPGSLHHVVRSSGLARIENDFHAQGAASSLYEARMFLRHGQNFTGEFWRRIRGIPRTRTDFVSPGDTIWTHWILDDSASLIAMDPFRPFATGQSERHSWLKGPLRPSPVPTLGPLLEPGPAYRSADTLFLSIPAFVDAEGHAGFNWYASSAFRLFRNGELVAETQDGAAGAFPVVPERAEYRLELDVDASANPASFLSPRTRTVWTLQSSAPPEGTEQPVPLVTVDYDVALDGFNRSVAASGRGGPNKIAFRVAHVEGAPAPAVTGLSLALSYDDGQTWRPVQNVRRLGGGRFEAILDARSPQSTSGFVSLRVHAADLDGNSVDQTIIRAYALRANGG